MSSTPRFTEADISWQNDVFPHLWELIFSNELRRTGKKSSQMDLWHGNHPKVKEQVAAIKARSWDFAIKNHRILEWLTIQVLQVILGGNRERNIVEYTIFLSHIVDDILNHTDAVLQWKTMHGAQIFWVDLTLWYEQITPKILSHSHWSNEITVWSRQRQVPHIILYTGWKTIITLTRVVEEAIKQWMIRGLKELKEWMVTLKQEKPELIIPDMHIATPDRWNAVLQTRLHNEVLSDFQRRIWAKSFSDT